jgi:RNA polymerase sigma factor (sigma-70 family)
MAGEPDELLLLRYAEAHEAGDHERAAELWEQLAVANFDRVQQIVKAFRFSAGGTGLPDHEWGSAATEAYLRVVSMGAGFRSRELGRFRAALVKCVEHACRDYGRRELRHERRVAGSIDERFEPGGDAGPYDDALAAHGAELRARAVDAVESERSRRDEEGLVAWAIDRIENAGYRDVLRSTLLERLPADAIAERLGISRDNVYARRSRGLRELKRILRGHGA